MFDPISFSIGFEYSDPPAIACFEYSIFSFSMSSRMAPAASCSLRAASRWLFASDCRERLFSCCSISPTLPRISSLVCESC